MSVVDNKNEVPEEKRFSANVIRLCEHVHRVVSKYHNKGYTSIDPALILFGQVILTGMSETDLINAFIKYTPMHWNKIKTRQRSFFIENANDIFKDFPTTHVDAFKTLFTIKIPDEKKGESMRYLITDDDEDTQAFWALFDSLVKITIKYIHRRRDPHISNSAAGFSVVYRNDKFESHLNLAELSKEWGINLLLLK